MTAAAEKTRATETEIDRMKHALGWPKNYRNHYAAGGADVAIWDGLVMKGFARKHRPTPIFPDRMYSVTDEGRAAIERASSPAA